MKSLRIGVFDSGVGGLTVLHELLQQVPYSSYLYFGDTARLPYGSKSAETVARYSTGAAHFLEQHGAELLVVACNTASALALDDIKASVRIPVVGVIEPGADSALAATKTRQAVVIATDATVSSHAYQRALEARGIHPFEKACPLLVPLVEEGWTDHPITEQVAHVYLDEAFRNQHSEADVLLLGCTHYPLIKPLLRRVAPQHVAIVDSAEATAAAVKSLLGERRAEPRPDAHTFVTCFATDSVAKFRRLGQLFLAHPIDDVTHVDLGG